MRAAPMRWEMRMKAADEMGDEDEGNADEMRDEDEMRWEMRVR